VKEINDDNFNRVIEQSKGVVIIHFWAKWSAPSNQLQQILDGCNFTPKPEVYILTQDSGKKTWETFKVRTIPQLLFYKDGVFKKRHKGCMTDVQLQQELKDLL